MNTSNSVLIDDMMDKHYTTIYKGLAILLIILCHTAGSFGGGRFTLFTPLGGIGVAVFLLLSGYGLNESWNSHLEHLNGGTAWWRKRFIAVWIPYIIVQLIAYWPFQKFEAIPFILDVSMIKPLYHNGWYLQYLFLWYFIFYVVRRADLLDDYRMIIFTVVSLVLFFLLREIKAEQSFSFILGILLSERKVLHKKLFNIRFGLSSMLLGIFCLAIKQLPLIRSAPQILMHLVQLGIKLPIGFGLIILCWLVVRKRKRIGVAFEAVGIISFELYLIHGYSLNVVPKNVGGLILFVILTGVLSVVFWWLMKKTKTVWLKMFRVD